MRLSLLIVDDNQEFLAAAARLLEAEGLRVVGRSRTGQEAVEQTVALAPDVVLVDVELGEEDGVELASRLAGLPDAPAVILISSHDQYGLQELLAPGPVVGFLTKDALSADAIRALLG